MEIVFKSDDSSPIPVQHRFNKLMIGTAAGFLATAICESLYDSLIVGRMQKKTVIKTD